MECPHCHQCNHSTGEPMNEHAKFHLCLNCKGSFISLIVKPVHYSRMHRFFKEIFK